jgi:pimeloyl-ACP methyl ester carboxylesterase
VPLSCEGIELSRDLLSQFSQNSGAMICEALKPDGAIYVEVRLGDELLYSYSVPIRVSSVRNMYRWMNLRYVVGDNSGESSKMWEPDNYPDEECDGKHFVFVHGYNVNASGARIWADAIFKRLWLAGSKSKFTAVDWRGDESQIYVPTQGDVSPNYYINVRHAFMTAEQAATNINALSGEKIILAHSLGNMLVSSAAKDYGLVYSKYYMINAAVPMEAYDEDANNSLMIDGAWSDIPESMRASRYSDLFSHTPNDFRFGLSWKGRFAGIQNAINCYSPTEDVLKNPKVNKIFGMSAGSDFGGAWSQQELFKGCALWYGVNSIAFSGAEIEGGWGINARYMANPLAYIPLSGFNPSYFSEYTREDLITKPLFTGMNEERMSTTNELNFVDANLRAKMLGDAIPAESFAAGANETGGGVLNYNMQIDTPNGWPESRSEEKDGNIVQYWYHSDIKNVSYYYVYKLFEKFIKEN